MRYQTTEHKEIELEFWTREMGITKVHGRFKLDKVSNLLEVTGQDINRDDARQLAAILLHFAETGELKGE